MSNQFYLCPQTGCNRKYKTKEKLLDHLLQSHKKLPEDCIVDEPVEITKENKKRVSEQKDVRVRQKDKEELLEQAKRAKEEFQQENVKRIKLIEEEKLKAEQASVEEKQKQLDIEKQFTSLLERVSENMARGSECVICGENDNSRAAVSPCGHSTFCHPCITEYKLNYNHRGCPLCRKPIQDIIKIYQ